MFMHEVNSPLIEPEKIKLIETINTKDIEKLYRQKNPKIAQLVREEFGNIKEISLWEGCQSGLKFFHPMITGSAKYYEQLEQDFSLYYMDDKDEYRCASKFILSTDRVLEIGAGRGAFTKHINPQKYLGLEFSDRAIKLAAQAGINLQKKSIEEYASNNNNHNSYSAVVSFQVLEHVADPSQFISAALKCLKENGLLIFSVPAEDSFIATSVNDMLNLPPHHVTRWSDRALQSLGKEFDLEVVKIQHNQLGEYAEYHKRWYLKCIVQSALMKLLRIKKKLVDTSILTTIVGKISAAIGLFLTAGFQEPELMPHGHTVTVVYRKNAGQNQLAISKQ